MISIRILNTDGTEETKTCEAMPPIAELQAMVGGYFQMIPAPWAFGIETSDTSYAMANEDGKRLDLPKNPHCGIAPNGDYLRGTVIVIDGDESYNEDEDDEED